MVAGDKAKKPKPTEGDDSDHVDGELVLSIEKLQEVQDQLEKINEEASDKVLEIEQKYNEVRRPIYIKRNEIMKSIPDFWLTAFLSHPALSDLLSEEDQEIFKYLDSLDVEDSKDVKSGYSITFNFKENPYFEDTKLTKTFAFSDDGSTKITGTNIRWKEGKGAANGVNHEKKGNIRPLHEISFFSWFGETDQKDIADLHQDEVADIIKDDLWSNPLKYFNNEADEAESDEDEEENGDEQEDNGEDDDEE